MRRLFTRAFFIFFAVSGVFAEKLSSEFEEEILFDGGFYVSRISDGMFEKMRGKSFKENCTVLREELSCVHVLHWDFDGGVATGEIICNKRIDSALLEIFKELFKKGYRIEKIRPIDEFDADDEKSMAANNTSCFNFRFINRTKVISKHGKGLAVDINPLYNPCVTQKKDGFVVEPASGAKYADRSKEFPHKIDRGDLAYRLFTEHGFEWGGDWNSPKDYQHFEWSE